MNLTTLRSVLLVISILAMATVQSADAVPTREQLRELGEIGKDVAKASSLIRRKSVEEAEKFLAECEQRLNKLAKDAELTDDNRALAAVRKSLGLQHKALNLLKEQMGGKEEKPEVSFAKDVAPILSSQCGNCHGDKMSGQLRLDTFAGMERGGKSGPLLVVGKPEQSLIMQRLTATGNERMPKNAAALSREQIETVANWIKAGAKFDGDKNTPLGQLKADMPEKPAPKKSEVPVVINKPTGNETVSFKDAIAPSLVNLCLGCHSGNNPRGGLSMVSFESLLRGGDSGRVLLEGDVEGSRLFRLIGALDEPRMPQGQGRITRKWYEDLQVWIKEGLKYDGGDPKTPLRDLVPTEEQKRRMQLAQFTPEQWTELREKRNEELWRLVVRNESARFVKSKEFYVYGNVLEERLQQINAWADEHAESLRSMFGVNEPLMWKGRLTIFVFKDRFGYTEFNYTIHRRETAREVTGHSVVTPTFEDAYIVLEDVGDAADANSPGLHVNLIDHLTGAFLKRSGATLPDWVVRGTGLALAARAVAGENVYVNGLRDAAKQSLQTIQNPEEVFENGKFSPTEIGPVGYALVDFMLKAGTPPKFGRFIQSLQSGSDVPAAVKAAYAPSDLKSLALGFGASFQKGKR